MKDMFDSHAHVGSSRFDSDRSEVMARAREAGLFGWLEVGTDVESSRAAIELAGSEEGVLATVGVHPSDVVGLSDADWEEMGRLLEHEKVVAVGEVGFDFYHESNQGTELEQHAAVIRFMELAAERELPMVFHVRDPANPAKSPGATAGRGAGSKQKSAHDLLISVLADVPEGERPVGVIHTFSGNKKQANQYLELGMYLSFSGVVTFKNAGEIAEVAKSMPLKKMLIETDCPFLAPEPYRGKRNEPAYVCYVAERIAELRGVAVEEIEVATDANARRLLEL